MEKLKDIPRSLELLDKKVDQLYFKGDSSLLKKPLVAIVGSRRPTAYTKRVVSMLANELAKRDVHVVSGAAMGVDALSHKGAYPKTIAVMGNSLDIIYPKVNESLIHNIYKNSLALSEYPSNTKATRYSFVHRNRIVVGLSKAVVIAQADMQSGSMHSANIAQKLGKPLYVLPQRLEESEGTNSLLANNQASLIDNIENFAQKFGKVAMANDDLLSFCKKNPSLEACLAKFKDKIYEYELEGKIEISGTQVRVL